MAYPVVRLQCGIHGEAIAEGAAAAYFTGQGRIVHGAGFAQFVRVGRVRELLEKPIRWFGPAAFCETLSQRLQRAP